jgi:hypothetical protein
LSFFFLSNSHFFFGEKTLRGRSPLNFASLFSFPELRVTIFKLEIGELKAKMRGNWKNSCVFVLSDFSSLSVDDQLGKEAGERKLSGENLMKIMR